MESNCDMYKKSQRRPAMVPSYNNNTNKHINNRYSSFKTSNTHSYGHSNGQNKTSRPGYDYDVLFKDMHHKPLSGRPPNYSTQQQRQLQQQQQQQQHNQHQHQHSHQHSHQHQHPHSHPHPHQHQQQHQHQRSTMQKEHSLINMTNAYNSNVTNVNPPNDKLFTNINALLSMDRKKYGVHMLNNTTNNLNNSNTNHNNSLITSNPSIMNTYTGTLSDWLYNQPPLPPSMSPKPQPPPPPLPPTPPPPPSTPTSTSTPKDATTSTLTPTPTSSSTPTSTISMSPSTEKDGKDGQKEKHETKHALYVKTPEKINETKEPLLPPPMPPTLKQFDDKHNSSVNASVKSSVQQQQSSKSKHGKQNQKHQQNNPNGKKTKNEKLTPESTKGKKTISDRYGNYVPKDWSRELAQKALDVESQYIKPVERLPVLLIRFPDPEITREIVSKYSEDICKVIFLQSTAPRYCTVHLKKDSDVTKTIEAISKIPFGNGFLHAELKRKTTVGSVLATADDIDPYTLYVGNLYSLITRNELRNHFPGSSRIDMGYAVCLKRTRYAFIRYTSVDDAIEAFKRTYNTQIGDRTMVIRFRRLNTVPNRDEDIEVPDAYLMEQDSLNASDANNKKVSVNNETPTSTTILTSTPNKTKSNNLANEKTTISSEKGKTNEFVSKTINEGKLRLRKDIVNCENQRDVEGGLLKSSTDGHEYEGSVMINTGVQTELSVNYEEEPMKKTADSSHSNNSNNASNQINITKSNDNPINAKNSQPCPVASQDFNITVTGIKKEIDINDGSEVVSSFILGRRFDAANNTTYIKNEPNDNQFNTFNDNVVSNVLTDNVDASASNATCAAKPTSLSTGSTISPTISSYDDDFYGGEILNNIADAIPADNLLGKRHIKTEPDESSCSRFQMTDDRALPLSTNVKKRNSTMECPNVVKKPCTTNNRSYNPQNSDIICIDDDNDDNDDVMIMEPSSTNSLELLRQRELSTRETKKPQLLHNLFINNSISTTSSSPTKAIDNERSAFAKKLYNETRHLEGEKDWENLLWSH